MVTRPAAFGPQSYDGLAESSNCGFIQLINSSIYIVQLRLIDAMVTEATDELSSFFYILKIKEWKKHLLQYFVITQKLIKLIVLLKRQRPS